jgi:RNA polymerase sigma factor (sigma-70 family)
MDPDTAIGGPNARFPETRLTALERVRFADAGVRRQAHETIVVTYWKPVYKYIRAKWHEGNEGAKDLTQSFFAKAVAAETFATFNPSESSFRTFVRMCVDRYVWKQRRFDSRQKRSGRTEPVTECSAADTCDPEELFHREWIREVFSASVAKLRTSSRPEVWRAFEMYDLAEELKPSYRQIAEALDVPVTQVTNYLACARRDLRRIVLSRIRSVTGSDAEYRSEVRAVLGIQV